MQNSVETRRYVSKLVKIIYEKEKVIEQLKREKREWEARHGGGEGEREMKRQIEMQTGIIQSLMQQMKSLQQRLQLLTNELQELPSEHMSHINQQTQIPQLNNTTQSLPFPPYPTKQAQDTSQLWRKQYEQSRKQIEELKIENHKLSLEITSKDNELQTAMLKIEDYRHLVGAVGECIDGIYNRYCQNPLKKSQRTFRTLEISQREQDLQVKLEQIEAFLKGLIGLEDDPDVLNQTLEGLSIIMRSFEDKLSAIHTFTN